MVNKIVTKAHVAEYSRGWPWQIELWRQGKKIVVKGWAKPIEPSPHPKDYYWAGHLPYGSRQMVWELKCSSPRSQASFSFSHEGKSYEYKGVIPTLKEPDPWEIAKMLGLSAQYDGQDAVLIPMDIVGMWRDD